MYTTLESIELFLSRLISVINNLLKGTEAFIVSLYLPIKNGLNATQSVGMGEVSIVLSPLDFDELIDEFGYGDVVLIFHTMIMASILGTLKLLLPMV